MSAVRDACQSYAVKFDLERPDAAPTDVALCEQLQHCALPPREEWLAEIRENVHALRHARLSKPSASACW